MFKVSFHSECSCYSKRTSCCIVILPDIVNQPQLNLPTHQIIVLPSLSSDEVLLGHIFPLDLLGNIFNMCYLSLLSFNLLISRRHTSDLGINSFLWTGSRLRSLVADRDNRSMTGVHIKVFIKVFESTIGCFWIQEVDDGYE